MKHELVEWMCINLTMAWLWVLTLVDPNSMFGMNVKW